MAKKRWIVYIIKSIKTGRNYIGYAPDLERRIREHSGSRTKSVRGQGPFKLIYTESFETRVEAVRREKQIKSYKGGRAFRKLIS